MYQSNTGVFLPTRIPSASTPLRSTEHQLCKWWIFLPEPQSWLGRISVGRVRGWGTEEPTTWGKAKWARVWIWEPEPKPGDKKKKKKKSQKNTGSEQHHLALAAWWEGLEKQGSRTGFVPLRSTSSRSLIFLLFYLSTHCFVFFCFCFFNNYYLVVYQTQTS